MSSPRLVLIIDQFEEVFTQCAGEQERQAFIRALCAARLLVRNLYSTTLQLHSSAAYRGRIMALRVYVYIRTTPVGSIITGAIISAAGARAALLTGAAACLVAGRLVACARYSARPGTVGVASSAGATPCVTSSSIQRSISRRASSACGLAAHACKLPEVADEQLWPGPALPEPPGRNARAGG